MPQPKIERRYFKTDRKSFELRTGDNGVKTLRGYAAVFNSMSEDLGWYREVLEPGCFDNPLKDPDLDTVALFNHNPDMVLARYPNTLRMKQDDKGLCCEMDLPDTQCARDLVANIEAGNIYQMSFAFTVQDARNEIVNGENVRYVSSVGSLYDVSPVTYPAYKATSISARSRKLETVDVDRLGSLLYRAENKMPLTADDVAFARAAAEKLSALNVAEEENANNSLELRKLQTDILKQKIFDAI